MSRRRMFDMELPTEDAAPPSPAAARRGPMAAAIGESSEARRQRAEAEAEIRAENDRLAHELVRLRKLGLVVERVPLDAIRTTRLTRDRHAAADLDIDGLKASLRSVGLSNPVRVVADAEGGYELVEGLRRLRAFAALRDEDGAAWAEIPAARMDPEADLPTLYRRMVDENLVRKSVSFGEMAALAIAYAETGVDGCRTTDEAVNRLYASAGAQKRSYIRRFVLVLRALGGALEHPQELPRALGLQVADLLEGHPERLEALARRLRDEPGRSAEREAAVLREAVADGPKPAPRKRGAPKRAALDLTLTVEGQSAPVRCVARGGRVELIAEGGAFETVAPARLEDAVAAFYRALGR